MKVVSLYLFLQLKYLWCIFNGEALLTLFNFGEDGDVIRKVLSETIRVMLDGPIEEDVRYCLLLGLSCSTKLPFAYITAFLAIFFSLRLSFMLPLLTFIKCSLAHAYEHMVVGYVSCLIHPIDMSIYERRRKCMFVLGISWDELFDFLKAFSSPSVIWLDLPYYMYASLNFEIMVEHLFVEFLT